MYRVLADVALGSFGRAAGHAVGMGASLEVSRLMALVWVLFWRAAVGGGGGWVRFGGQQEKACWFGRAILEGQLRPRGGGCAGFAKTWTLHALETGDGTVSARGGIIDGLS